MKINNTTFELKYSFKAIKEILNATNTTLDKIGELAQDINNVSLIAAIGNKYAGGTMTVEDFETLFDEGTFEDLLSVISEFGRQVGQYFPNSQSQA